MKLIGQAWIYRVGNSVVRVENAFAWSLWAQERLLVNDEVVKSADGWGKTRRDFDEDWLTPLGEGLLRIRIVSGLMKIHCDVTLDDGPIHPERLESAVWNGARGDWPPPGGWAAAGEKRWHAPTAQPPP